MTEDLIKKLKDVKQALVSKDMTGEEWEEREEILEKLEDVTTYLKDDLGKGFGTCCAEILELCRREARIRTDRGAYLSYAGIQCSPQRSIF